MRSIRRIRSRAIQSPLLGPQARQPEKAKQTPQFKVDPKLYFLHTPSLFPFSSPGIQHTHTQNNTRTRSALLHLCTLAFYDPFGVQQLSRRARKAPSGPCAFLSPCPLATCLPAERNSAARLPSSLFSPIRLSVFRLYPLFLSRSGRSTYRRTCRATGHRSDFPNADRRIQSHAHPPMRDFKTRSID